MDLRKKNNILITIILVLILFILVSVVCLVRVYLSGGFECECEECKVEETNFINKDTLDNSSYIGIYSHEDNSNKSCILTTTLVLNSDYSSIFYIGDCNNRSYYYGKYRVEDKKIVLYSVVLQDTTSSEEIKVEDESIYFNIVDSEVITSIFGRDKSIRLNKLYNIV